MNDNKLGRKRNGHSLDYGIAEAHARQVDVLRRRITDLEIELGKEKAFTDELLSYKQGLEKENVRLEAELSNDKLRDSIDKEMLS